MRDDVSRGQPPKYKDVKLFQKKIDEYFVSITDKDGEYKKPPTVSGMAIFLGFVDRKSMYHYRDKDQFYAPVKRAIGMVEAYNEEKAAGGSRCAGNIFILKNFDWTDRQEVTNKGDMSVTWNEEKTYGKDDADTETE
jgi:hypothetical protein